MHAQIVRRPRLSADVAGCILRSRGGSPMNVQPKRTVTIEVDEEVARRIEAEGLSVAAEAERLLRRRVLAPAASGEAERWAEENREAIAWHQRMLDEHGTFAERMAKFRR
jgi:post-segregation antitoxin (ccd killing protein)